MKLRLAARARVRVTATAARICAASSAGPISILPPRRRRGTASEAIPCRDGVNAAGRRDDRREKRQELEQEQQPMTIEIPGHVNELLAKPMAELTTLLDPQQRQAELERELAPIRQQWAHDADQRAKAERHRMRQLDEQRAMKAGEVSY